MPRRFSLAAILAVALAMLAAPAFAGGWAEVTLDTTAPTPGDDGTTVVGFTLLQHGVTPVDWGGVTVVATDSSGATVSASATVGQPGHWTAALPLGAGSWEIEVRHSDLQVTASGPMTVGAAEVTATSSAPPVSGVVLALLFAAVMLPIAGGLALLAATRRPRANRAPELPMPAPRRA